MISSKAGRNANSTKKYHGCISDLTERYIRATNIKKSKNLCNFGDDRLQSSNGAVKYLIPADEKRKNHPAMLFFLIMKYTPITARARAIKSLWTFTSPSMITNG